MSKVKLMSHPTPIYITQFVTQISKSINSYQVIYTYHLPSSKTSSNLTMEGLIPFVMHAMKKHKGHKGYRSLSARYHLLEGSVTVEGSSHRRTRSDFQPPTADYLQQRSGFGYDTQSMNFKKDSTSSTPNTFHASKIKGN